MSKNLAKWRMPGAAGVAVSLLMVTVPCAAETTGEQVNGIYKDSNARLPQVKRDDLDTDGKRIFDSLTAPGARYANGLRGPAAMWMYDPDVAEKATALGRVVRNSPILGPKLTELAIVVTGIELDDTTESTSHLRLAVAAGLSPAAENAVREGGSVDGLDPKEALVIAFARQVVGKHHLDKATFDSALQAFGPRGVTDLQALIGHYMLCNATNATFDIRARR